MDLATSYMLKGLGALLVLGSATIEDLSVVGLVGVWGLAIAIGYAATLLAIQGRRER